MKNKFLLLVTFTISSTAFCQMDTIYSNNEKLAVNVKEITEDAVKYTYPNEDLINTSYKNTIQKIVLKSGRVQTFTNKIVYNSIIKPSDDYKVIITNLESDIKGLYRLGNINASIKGGTVFSNVDKMKDIAYKKLQKIATLMGGNIVYVTNEHSATGQMGGYFQAGKLTEASFSGYLYTNKLLDFNELKNKITVNSEYKVLEYFDLGTSDRDYGYDNPMNVFYKFSELYNENGIIYLVGLNKRNKETLFQVANFDDTNFYLYTKDKTGRSYQYKFKF